MQQATSGQKHRSWLRRLGVSAAIASVATAASLVVATPAHAANAVTLTWFKCVEESNEWGDDSPYFIVLTVWWNTPGGYVTSGHWGPGRLDNEVSSGETHTINAPTVSARSGAWILTAIGEEDDGHDLNSNEYQYIENHIANWTTYLQGQGVTEAQAITTLRRELAWVVDYYQGDDDLLGVNAVKYTGAPVTFDINGGGARYRVSFSPA